jgi:hypothetical protein
VHPPVLNAGLVFLRALADEAIRSSGPALTGPASTASLTRAATQARSSSPTPDCGTVQLIRPTEPLRRSTARAAPINSGPSALWNSPGTTAAARPPAMPVARLTVPPPARSEYPDTGPAAEPAAAPSAAGAD